MNTYHTAFAKLLSALNPAQAEAVAHLEGPMLVVAGPGTGKTHLLAARIGQILLATDTAAHNILCLTFTDAGVQAMRKRLLAQIGTEAHKLHIYTFHSFCSTVIQENADYFGRHELEPLSELERIEIIRSLIDELPPEHPIKRLKALPYFWERALIGLFQTMKSESWTVDYVVANIKNYIADLPNREEYRYQRKSGANNKGDLKTDDLKTEITRVERLAKAAELFTRYNALVQARGRFDFEDMLQWVRRAFTENTRLLRRYQEQYLQVLIDEYQDTNGVQNEILRLLMAYWDNPNIFAVGDDDQAIYEFQGARLKNILDFAAQHQATLRTVLLTENYRSTQPILTAANRLISHNKLRLVAQLHLDKTLIAQSKNTDSAITATVYPNILQEEIAVVQHIVELQAAGVALSEIAVIYKEHKQANRLSALLKKANIAIAIKKPYDVLQSQIVQILMLCLDYLTAEHQQPYSGEAQLFELLHYSFTGVAVGDIARLAYYKQQKNTAKTSDDDSDEYSTAVQMPCFWQDLLTDTAAHENLHLAQADNLQYVGAWTQSLLAAYKNLPLPQLIAQLINRSGLLQWIAAQPDRFELLQMLHTFVEFVQNAALQNPKMTVADLRKQLAAMQEAGVALNILQANYLAEAVTLTTAHAAKGLEFGTVFMIDCSYEIWDKAKNAGGARFVFPDTLTLTNVVESHTEAARRLFYVGMTRAKTQLHFSYAQTTLDGKRERLPSQFLTEVLADSDIKLTFKSLSDSTLTDWQTKLLTESADTLQITPQLFTHEIDAILADFALSASSYNRFLDCPLAFYYQHILAAPSAGSDALAYGQAVHYALRRVYDRLAKLKQPKFGTTAQFVKDFEAELGRWQSRLTPQEYQNKLALGRVELPPFYAQNMPRWNKKAMVERYFKNVVVDGIPIKGQIDKMDNVEGFQDYWNLTDFKTGKPENAVFAPPSDAAPLGSPVFRQLVFYKILVENYRGYNWMVESGTVQYVAPNKNGQYDSVTYFLTAEHTAILRESLKTVWARIVAHDFYTGCNKPTCKWCNFVKKHQNEPNFDDDLDAVFDDV
jgi:DNA helicase II / ATP-dependent DNA helicase PcrA